MYTYIEKKNEPCHRSALVAPAVALGRDFCMETSMHGFRHVAEPRRHWAERLIWVAITSLAIWGAVNVSLGQLQRYNENPTVVTLEKDFRSWQFSLPAVTTCIKNRTDPVKLEAVIKKLWNVEPSDQKFGYYSRFVRTVTDSDLLHLESYVEFKDDEELNVDLFQLALDVMPEIDIKITVENVNYLKWIPVMTEAGACYSVNSLAIGDVTLVETNPNDTMMYPVTCKYGGASCYIMLLVSNHYDFYFHSPYDILDIAQPASTVFLRYLRTMDLSVLETRCGRGVKDLSPQRRACLFTDEPVKGKKVYSTNSCRLSCRSKLAMEICNCIPFYYFYEDGPICSPAGMACLSLHAHTLGSIGGPSYQCPCSAQCLYTVFRKISTYDQMVKDSGPFALQGSIKYIVLPPKIRYTREIVFHFQDLVVSFGGAAGLFLGASFISFVEIIYFLLERVLRAVSLENTRDPSNDEKSKKASFEEQRVLELTTILEQNQWNQEDLKRNVHF